MSEGDQNSKRSFDDLVADEFKLVKERREKFQQPSADSPYLTGLALSGGGIRSATYSLGFLQALSRLKIFPKIDYLSTVSGGSYIGSFFGALFLSKEFRGSQAAASTKTDLDFDPSDPLQSPRGLEAVRKLREAGRYLTPGGTSDAAFAAAVVARNWLALHIVLGIAVVLMFWLTHLSDAVFFASFKIGPSPTLAIFTILALVFIFGQAAAYWITSRDWIHPTLLMRMLNSGVFWGLVAASIGGILVSYHVIKQPGLHIWISNHFSLSNSLNTSETGRNILNALSGIEHIGIFVALSAGCAIISYIWAEHKVGGLPPGAKRNNPNFLGEAQDRIRGYLSRKLSLGLVAISALFVFAAMQWLGRVWEELLVENFGLEKGFTDWANLSAAILAFGPPLLSYLASKGLKSGSSFESPIGHAVRKISGPLFSLAALALLAAWLIFWSVVAFAGFSASQSSTIVAQFSFLGLTAMTILVAGALFFAYAAAARSFSFINLSSLATFYAARLKRAYIGASSREREHGSVAKDYDQDNISLKQYYTGGAETQLPAEWSVGRIRVVRSVDSDSAPTMTTGIDAGSIGSGVGSSEVYDPFAGAAPNRKPDKLLTSGIAIPKQSIFVENVTGFFGFGGEDKIDSGAFERLVGDLRQRLPRAEGSVLLSVFLDSKGKVKNAEIVGGTASAQVKFFVRNAVIGKQLAGGQVGGSDGRLKLPEISFG